MTAEYWQYDSRLGRRWNIDPMSFSYPFQSPYATFNNNPIFYADPSGLEGEPAQKTAKVEAGSGPLSFAKKNGVGGTTNLEKLNNLATANPTVFKNYNTEWTDEEKNKYWANNSGKNWSIKAGQVLNLAPSPQTDKEKETSQASENKVPELIQPMSVSKQFWSLGQLPLDVSENYGASTNVLHQLDVTVNVSPKYSYKLVNNRLEQSFTGYNLVRISATSTLGVHFFNEGERSGSTTVQLKVPSTGQISNELTLMPIHSSNGSITSAQNGVQWEVWAEFIIPNDIAYRTFELSFNSTYCIRFKAGGISCPTIPGTLFMANQSTGGTLIINVKPQTK